MGNDFVKSAGTDVSAGRSRNQLEDVLRRYGCSGFGIRTDYATMRVTVTFFVPDTPTVGAITVPVQLEIDVQRVHRALFARRDPRRKVTKEQETKRMVQAERVAWRQLIVWVDAALSAAATGLQPISEAFLAHTLMKGENGRTVRVVDHLNALAGGNWLDRVPKQLKAGN